MWHSLIQNKEQSSARLAEKAAKKKLAMASGKSTIKPSKKSTAMHYSIKCLLPHMYGFVVPLPSVEKKK